MALTADQFAKSVITAGLSSAEEIKTLWAALPAGSRPKDGESFAQVLVQRKMLTPFQAAEILAGSPTPLVLGDYELLAKIGAGGMGQVFKARHRHMDRLAAIKLLPAAMTRNDDAVKRFQREVKAAAKLSHPNIVQTYDAGVQRGVWYLVMEYVEGRDLAGVSSESGPLAIERAVDYVRQTAQGLAFAHENGVVHRDIKPANLLLDKKGNIKILDMGLARFDDAAAAKDGLTQSGQVMGTVDYMAPEQAFDTRFADARADVYSLGCTLFRLLTGTNLFEGDTIVQKLIAHQQQPVPDLLQKRTDAPRELDAIFRKMVAKKPAERFQTMAELEAVLAAFQAKGHTRSTSATHEGTVAFSNSPRSINSSGPPMRSTAADMATLAPTQAANLATRSDEPTMALVSPQQVTDPVSPQSVQIARELTRKRIKVRKPPFWLTPPWLVAGGLGGILLVLLGIWVIVRDKDGKEVGRIKVPDGGKAEMVPDQVAAKPNKLPAAKVDTAAKGGAAKGDAAKADSTNGVIPKTSATVVDTAKMRAPNGPAGEFALQFEPGPDSSVMTDPLPHPTDVPRTFEVWCKVTEASVQGNCLVYSRTWGNLMNKDDDVTFYTFHGHVLATLKPFPFNQRIHLAGVNDGLRRHLFLNGKLIATSNDAGFLDPTPNDLAPFVLGNGVGTGLSGEIYAVRVSSIARYTSDFTPPAQFTSDRVTELLFDFHEGEGTTLHDSSGHNRHGKIVNAKWVKTGTDSSARIADRRAAELFYPNYANLKLRLKSGSEIELTREPKRPLPNEPYELIGLDFISTVPPPDFAAATLLPALQGLTSLEEISNFWEGSLTTDELARLAESRFADKLKVLIVGYCDLSAANLDLLKKFTKLERIGLRAARPTAELLTRLNAEHPGLKFLGFGSFAVEELPDEPALKALSAFPIEFLDVHRSGNAERRISEAIAAMPNLKLLAIQSATLDDDAAAPLGRCPKLEVLKLDFSNVSDKSLAPFDSLSTLKLLHVHSTKITDEGAKQFAQRHPKCRVVTTTLSLEASK